MDQNLIDLEIKRIRSQNGWIYNWKCVIIILFPCLLFWNFYNYNYIYNLQIKSLKIKIKNFSNNFHYSKAKIRPACNIEKLDPFNPLIKPYYNIPVPKNLNCSTGVKKRFPALFSSTFDTLKKVGNETAHGFKDCCYKIVVRINTSDDNAQVKGNCIPILDNETKIKEEFIVIYCKNSSNENQSIPIDMHAFFHLDEKLLKRLNINSRNNSSHEKLNVAMFGLDAMSHMTILRTMPKTIKFLNENLEAFSLHGYTKTGDNTFPHHVALLMGKLESELKCWKDIRGKYFDNCTFIWNDYIKKGYVSSFGETCSAIGTFNYLKSGFLNKPTDFYFRPFGKIARDLSITRDPKFCVETSYNNYCPINTRLCFGAKFQTEMFLDYFEKFAAAMAYYKQNYIQLLWDSSMSHDGINNGRILDGYIEATLQRMEEKNYLNNTVFVFLSDHGIRWGGIMSTVQGKVEARMPFFYIAFPAWFKKKYPKAMQNFQNNKNLLTSPLDNYEVLKDILNPESISDENIKERTSGLIKNGKFPRSISLFLPIPLERKCATSGIDYLWCACHDSKPIKFLNKKVYEASRHILKKLNEKLTPHLEECEKLELDKILSIQELYEDNFPKFKNVMTVSFQVKPSKALFQATAIYTFNNKTGFPTEEVWFVSDAFSRNDLYGNQSWCVDNKSDLKMLCYCKNQLNSTNKMTTFSTAPQKLQNKNKVLR